VGTPHVRVGHRQAFILNALMFCIGAFFFAQSFVPGVKICANFEQCL
jgi:hypothetical protein